MELWQAVVLGLVEGITEYLPVSSTGHLILVSALLGLDRPEIKASIDAFEIVVQGGAILAVLSIYWPRVLRMIRGIFGKDPAGLRLAVNLVIAFIPAAILGKLLDHWIESHLFYPAPVLGALFVGGVYMIGVDRWTKRGRPAVPVPSDDPVPSAMTIDSITPVQAFGIGLMQCVAMWPGTSRSMMTITGGMLIGLPAAAAAEFSFLLGLPALGAATLYKAYKNVSASHAAGVPDFYHQLGPSAVLVGILVATVSAALAVKWLVGFLKRRGLAPFGWYRIALSLVLVGLLFRGRLHVRPREAAPQLSAPIKAP